MRIKDPLSEPEEPFNLVPLTDMVFNLLIFFMAATTFAQVEKEIGIQLPKASSFQTLSAPPKQMVININEQGKPIVNHKEYDLTSLREHGRGDGEAEQGQQVVIRADRRGRLEGFADVVDVCKTGRRAGGEDQLPERERGGEVDGARRGAGRCNVAGKSRRAAGRPSWRTDPINPGRLPRPRQRRPLRRVRQPAAPGAAGRKVVIGVGRAWRRSPSSALLGWWAVAGNKVWTDGAAVRVADADARLREVVWTRPEPLSGLNTPDHEYEPAVSPDGDELYFVRGKAGTNAGQPAHGGAPLRELPAVGGVDAAGAGGGGEQRLRRPGAAGDGGRQIPAVLLQPPRRPRRVRHLGGAAAGGRRATRPANGASRSTWGRASTASSTSTTPTRRRTGSGCSSPPTARPPRGNRSRPGGRRSAPGPVRTLTCGTRSGMTRPAVAWR